MKLTSLRATVLVMMMALLASCGLFKPGPSKVVKNFYRDVEAGKIEDATKLFSAQAVQTFGSKLSTVMSAQTRKIEKKGGIKSIDTQESITGDLAKVEYTVTYNDGSTEQGNIDLIKEEGDWKIQLGPNK